MIAFTVPGKPRVSDDAIVEAYDRLGSVAKVASEVGLNGSSVHERLVKLGANRKPKLFTDGERQQIRDYYENAPSSGFDLKKLAARLQRPHTSIARIAGEMGLTSKARKPGPESVAATARGVSRRWATHGHPKGMLGKVHGPGFMTEARRQQASDTMAAWKAAQPAENCFSHAKRGRRADLDNRFFRSAWEANYARYLTWLAARGEILGWEYEPETFWFDTIKRGVRSYLPDFRVHERDASYYVEIKGYMTPRSRTALDRMARYYPATEVRLVDSKAYAALAKSISHLIAGWEK